MKVKKALFVGLLVLLVFCLGSISFNLQTLEDENDLRANYIVFPPIYIDDTDPSHDWNAFLTKYPFVLGTGTSSDPFRLFNLVIDGAGYSYCISIKNSLKFFIIQDSNLFGADINVSAGVYLENTYFAHFYGNTIYHNNRYGIYMKESIAMLGWNSVHGNTDTGIYLEDCVSTLVYTNVITNHNEYSIKLNNCVNIQINDNDMGDNEKAGIGLFQSNHTEIIGNGIMYCNDGIYLKESTNNNLEGNNISDGEECGIHLEWYSNDNSITSNTVTDIQDYCIRIGISCQGTILSDNGNCTPSYFDERGNAFNNLFDFDFSGYLSIILIPISSIIGLTILMVIGEVLDLFEVKPRKKNKPKTRGK